MRRVGPLLFGLAACAVACRRGEPAPSTTRALRLPAEAVDSDPAPNALQVRLRASPLQSSSGDYRYSYDGSVPGPTIRGRVGDTVEVVLDNALTSPTTIHWHGMKVPWAMDGATWMLDPIMPGETFRYRFRLERAGTFWYHPHFDTEGQVDGGLFGAVIVEDPAEPRLDEELVLVFDAAGEGHGASPASGHAHAHTRWLVNGEERPVHRARGGSRIRARLINASNAGYLALRWPGIRHIGSDQGLLPSLQQPERLLLTPGDRADVEVLVGADAIVFSADPYSLNGGDSHGMGAEVMRIEVDTPAPAPSPAVWPFPGGTPEPVPDYYDLLYALAGSDRSGSWFINGEQFPNVTVETLSLGSAAIVEVRNVSPTEHPFHFHGLSFEVLAVNGVPPPYKTVEDTFNLEIRDRLRVRVEADNPGEWMLHCHILPHAHEGMMTVLRVAPP